MPVFKLCLKILKKQLPIMLVYLIVFLVISLLMSSFITKEQQRQDTLFTQAKSDIAFISEENTPLVKGFKQELGRVANFVELPDEKKPCRTLCISERSPISCGSLKALPKVLCREKMRNWKRQLFPIPSAALISTCLLSNTLIQPGFMCSRWRISLKSR